MVAVFTGAAQHEDGQDGHDDAAEGAGAEDGVDETDEAAVSQEDWRDDDEGQAAGSRTDVRFRFKAQAVDHIGQEAFGNGPERCEHGTESESVDDDEEDRRSQGTAPGQGCDFRNFIDWQHEEDRQGDQSQDDEGNAGPGQDGRDDFPRVMREAPGDFRNDILDGIAEDGDIEDRYSIGPMGVENICDRYAGRKQ